MNEELNLQTAKIEWQELQRHFARGVVVIVDSALDLVKIGSDFIEDNSADIAKLMAEGKVRKAEIEDASRWHEADAIVWAVVVAPWVLVQEIEE